MTNGKKHEVDWAKILTLHPGACVVFDRGFTDYSWYQQLTKRKITFVTRLKRNAIVFRLGNRNSTDSDTIQSDQKIKLKRVQTDFRLIEFRDPDTGKEYQFLTNSLSRKATEVAALYKERWQIDCFSNGSSKTSRLSLFYAHPTLLCVLSSGLHCACICSSLFCNLKQELALLSQKCCEFCSSTSLKGGCPWIY